MKTREEVCFLSTHRLDVEEEMGTSSDTIYDNN
jgi:hypothetical protein